jgi:hypothetical protein
MDLTDTSVDALQDIHLWSGTDTTYVPYRIPFAVWTGFPPAGVEL